MGLYRFPCVGPEDADFDMRRRRLPAGARVRAQADRGALAVMDGAEIDWTRWIVDVRDAKGRRVLVREFTDACVATEQDA